MVDGMPAVVGGYEVVGRVGSGSTGAVFKARDTGLGRDVALEQVPSASIGLLRAEAARLAQLDDPHVVSVYGFVEEQDAAYLVLEWVEGATLAEVLATGGRLSTAQALGVVRGALLGLAHAHSRDVVHGDVSASNVLVDAAGESRLIDFGVGGSTPAYRAPEARQPGAPLTPAADVYAAAAVLVQLLTGRTAPDAAPDLSGIDAGVRPVVHTALSPDPAARYPDAAAFLAALEEAAERTWGALWWTTAGIPALVGPAVGAFVPIGGAAAGGVAGGVVAGAAVAGRETGKRSWKLVVGAGAAAALVVAGAVTAVALSSGDDDPDAPTAEEQRIERERAVEMAADRAVVESVPTGAYTYRSVVVSSTLPAYYPIGTETTRIWTFEADCETASSCGGTITSSSGSSFEFTWDGQQLRQSYGDNPATYVGECTETDTGVNRGTVTVRYRYAPDPQVFTGAPAEDGGLPAELSGTETYREQLIKYVNENGGREPVTECSYDEAGTITKLSTSSRVSLTLGSDPDVVASEAERVAEEEKAAAEASETP